MKGVTYAFLGTDDEAARLGKKGTSTDITLFNGKKGDAHLNLVTPLRFPQKIQSLLFALDMADVILLPPRPLDRFFGEIVLAADLLGKVHGYLLARDGDQLLQIQSLLAKTRLNGLVPFTESEPILREKLYEAATASSEGNLVLPIDHVFPVKGVGTVVLGLVRSGMITSHQTLRLYPDEKTVEVRGIQVHDVDVSEAPARSRVGLAIKGVEAEEATRGHILAPPGSLSVVRKDEPVRLRIAYTPFTKWDPRLGSVFHLFHALQFIPLRIDEIVESNREGVHLLGRPDVAMAMVPDAPLVAVDLDNKSQRLIGRVKPQR